MKTHFKSWFELAETQFGLGLKQESLMFVSGTVKTRSWVVSILRGPESSDVEASSSIEIGDFVDGSLSIHRSEYTIQGHSYRSGPTTPTASPEADQCIFIHYWKMKRKLKLVPTRMTAAAGPHVLPPGDSNDGPGETSIKRGTGSSECVPDKAGAQV